MLVLSRQRGEEIVIGSDRMAHAELSPLEMQALRNCTEPQLLDLAERLLKSVGRIVVAAVDLRCDKVRLGVSAKKCIGVHRKEIYDAIRRENRADAEGAVKG